MPSSHGPKSMTTNKPVGAFTHNLALRGKSVNELRALATQHLELTDAQAADTQDLIAQLSAAATQSSELAAALRRDSISIKPSFYVMSVVRDRSDVPTLPTIRRRLVSELID